MKHPDRIKTIAYSTSPSSPAGRAEMAVIFILALFIGTLAWVTL